MPQTIRERNRFIYTFLSSFLLLVFLSAVYSQIARAELLIVSVAKARVRYGPGSDFGTIWKLTAGYPLKRIGKKGDWIHVRDLENDKGWIHKTLVKKANVVVVARKIVNVRKGPGTNFAILMKCERGVVLKKLKMEKGWLKVKHEDGEIGYIHPNLVWK